MYMDNYINLLDGTICQTGGSEPELTPEYTEHVSEPWFSLISLGLKTVEGRKNKGRFGSMKPGQIIKWINEDFKPRHVYTKITQVTTYDTFEDYLRAEGLEKCLPSINDMEIGLSVYFKYFTKEDEAKYGVVAIQMEKII